ncbi:glycoside hydrolase family 43 C-terminal domain-containing protein [uncultured Lactobacillus sp.]|uniref:lipocalin-like domain-containing protein n=1 Tax=uncultured Lactobacillus sp. TaxID=153152 RepID=UPI0034562330
MDIIKQIPGQYEFVNNGRATSSTPIAKSSIKLEKNNRTSGGINSTWETVK